MMETSDHPCMLRTMRSGIMGKPRQVAYGRAIHLLTPAHLPMTARSNCPATSVQSPALDFSPAFAQQIPHGKFFPHYLLSCCCFETASHTVLADLELATRQRMTLSSGPSCLYLPSVGIMGVCHHSLFMWRWGSNPGFHAC